MGLKDPAEGLAFVSNIFPLPESGISQEEDGDLSEYNGNTSFFGTTTSPTISGSEYAIACSTDGTSVYSEATFEGGEYNQFSMYVYPEQKTNNEVMLVDPSNGNVVLGIYFRSDAGIYYSGSNNDQGSISNSGSTRREDGVELVSGGNTSPEYYHIELKNIDWLDEVVDIAVDGAIVKTGEPFILSGVPSVLQINSNSGSSKNRGYIDKIDLGN